MRISVAFFLILQSICCAWSQTEKQPEYNQIVDQLEIEIQKGKKRALRDLGSILHKKDIDQKVRRVFANTTFFTPDEIDVQQCSKSDFLSFYYDNEQKIQYSELLRIFYITPLEDRKIGFEMRSVSKEDAYVNTGLVRRYFMDIDELLNLNKFKEADSLIDKIIPLEAINKEVLFFDLLKDERVVEIPIPLRNEIYIKILDQLTEYPKVEIVEIVLKLMENGLLNDAYGNPFLLKITNCQPGFQSNLENTIDFYHNLVDSLETLEEIRKFGYEQVFNFKINFFQFPVDYYGKIIGMSTPYPWLRQNALLDLKRSNHPRALFYIAADYYRTRHNTDESIQSNHVQLINSKTNVEIGVKNLNGKITFHPEKNDEIAMLNYLTYWASSYQDYEWDENRNIFTSKMEAFAKTQNYERLFRRFNSKNDSIALLAFLQLTEGDPIEVVTLAKKYRQLLRNHNSALPSMKYKYLEQLTLLTAFCRKNNIDYKPDQNLISQLTNLAGEKNEKERYHIENQLIESLTLAKITAVEYWACIHEKNESLSLSIGRILDWFYSKNWEKIINNSDNLRLYLKKSYLFGNIGVEGVCNNYLNKFDISVNTQSTHLYELGKIESDRDILSQILLLLEQEPEEEIAAFGIEEFVQNPLVFNKRDIKMLPAPSSDELDQIIQLIQKTEDTEVIKKYFGYLRLNSNIAQVPKLFKLIDDERVLNQRGTTKITVADNIIPIVENVLSFKGPKDNPDHPFATGYWKSLWKKDSVNFQQWGKQFYQQSLDTLLAATQLSIKELNQLTGSPYYSDDFKSDILRTLKKVKPIKNIRRLNIDPKLSVEEDLKYFEDFVFTYKVLDDIPKLFDINNDNAGEIIDFLIEKSSSFNYSEKGSFYNNLFRSPWLNNFLNSRNMNPSKTDTIQSALINYLDESSFLSEYEEQATILNISKLENIGKSLDTKINAVLKMEVDIESKAKILKEIIATISYAEISNIVIHFEEVSQILGDEDFTFFHRDFGLPIFQINNAKQQKELLQKHQNLSEFDFYKYYLKKYNIDFLDKNDQLDFEKIYGILQFDIITPFAGEGGNKRDEYIFGIIRLLEIHFGTRLGFHEKLNEYQTFYSFSSAKRAEAWVNYFHQNQLIVKGHFTPSFNQARKEITAISNNSAKK